MLKWSEGAEIQTEGRFQAINALLEAKALQNDKQFENLLEDYLKKDFINGHIFKLM